MPYIYQNEEAKGEAFNAWLEVMVMNGELDGAMEIFEKEEWDNGEKKT